MSVGLVVEASITAVIPTNAGAIVSGGDETAEAKMKILSDCNIDVSKSVADIGEMMKPKMEKNYAK